MLVYCANLAGITAEKRTGRFVCVLAAARLARHYRPSAAPRKDLFWKRRVVRTDSDMIRYFIFLKSARPLPN